MNLVSMFADSQILKDLQSLRYCSDTQLQQIILKSQMGPVNFFIAEIVWCH